MAAVSERKRSSAAGSGTARGNGAGAGGARAKGTRTNGARSKGGTPKDEARNGNYRVRRFDADREDREVTLETALRSAPTSRQLLWVDVVGEMESSDIEGLARKYDFDAQTQRALESPAKRAELVVHGNYFHLSVGAPAEDLEDPPIWLHLIAGRNVVITRHVVPLKLLDEIDDRIKTDASVGAVEAAEFVALLLDSVVTSYFAAVDGIEDEIDELDARSLRADDRMDVLDDLIRLRRRIARLRRVVAIHRSVFPALNGPDLRQLIKGQDAVQDMQAVANRYEGAVSAVESSREALIGSFEVFMTRTAHRTNEIMKILTIATVLLLPGSVIAGFLGMNVIVPLNADDPISFWYVVAGVGLLAIGALVLAKRRRWI